MSWLRHSSIIASVLGLVALTGCESEQDRAKLQADIQHLHDVGQAEIAEAQWRLDDAKAKRIFWRYYSDADPEPTPAYETFVKCHNEPPTHEANKKVCAALQARVVAREAKYAARNAKDKAAW